MTLLQSWWQNDKHYPGIIIIIIIIIIFNQSSEKQLYLEANGLGLGPCDLRETTSWQNPYIITYNYIQYVSNFFKY